MHFRGVRPLSRNLNAALECGENVRHSWSGLGAKLESKRSPDSVINEVLEDLVWLRKGFGFTSRRLVTRPALVQVLGGVGTRDELLEDRLRSAIESLGEKDGKPVDDARLLMEVFGLCSETAGMPYLQDRRRIIGNRLGITSEAVADRESRALKRLRDQLISGWYPKSPIPGDQIVPHGGASIIYFYQGLVLDHGGFVKLWNRIDHLVNFDGAEFIQFDTGSTDELVVVQGDYRVEEVRVRNGRSLRFYPPRPMRRGQTYQLNFSLEAASGTLDPTIVEHNYNGFHEPTQMAVFETEFRGLAPKWIWWFSNLTTTQAPGNPYKVTLLEPDSSGRVRRTFTDVRPGLFSGLAWEWELPHHNTE